MPTAAFLTDAPRVAGSEVWLLSVLPHLPALGIAPAVFLPVGTALDTFAGRLTAAGLPVTRFERLAELPALTRDFDVRVMHAWGLLTYARLLPKLAAPRWVVIHDQLAFGYPLGLQAFYSAGFLLTKGLGMRSADGVLTVSQWGQRWLSRRLRREVGFVLNPVDTRRFSPAQPDERAALRAEFGFTRFTVLVPGRFVARKTSGRRCARPATPATSISCSWAIWTRRWASWPGASKPSPASATCGFWEAAGTCPPSTAPPTPSFSPRWPRTSRWSPWKRWPRACRSSPPRFPPRPNSSRTACRACWCRPLHICWRWPCAACRSIPNAPGRWEKRRGRGCWRRTRPSRRRRAGAMLLLSAAPPLSPQPVTHKPSQPKEFHHARSCHCFYGPHAHR